MAKGHLPIANVHDAIFFKRRLGVDFKSGHRIDSMKSLMGMGFDAIFVGSGAPRGRNLDIPGREQAKSNIHIGIDWLASVSFGHVTEVGKKVIVLGGGNTASAFARLPLPGMPLYTGTPWFMPVVGNWYRLRDWLDGWRVGG